MSILVLGAARFPSPLERWVNESERVPVTIVRTEDKRPEDALLFEVAGARQKLFFNPAETRAGIVRLGAPCFPLQDNPITLSEVIPNQYLSTHRGLAAAR